jgi:hypothetical protein
VGVPPCVERGPGGANMRACHERRKVMAEGNCGNDEEG